MDEDDYAFLNYCEQMYHMQGQLPSEGQAIAVGHTRATYRRCVKLPVFNSALDARGIREGYASLDDKGQINPQLSPEMLNAANVMLDLRDNRSQKKKLQELAIPTQKWETWIRDPIFQQYLQIRSENLLNSNGHEAHIALLERVRAGEMSAIKYFNEMTGRYVPERTKGVDVQSVILRVIEIIQIHVSDPAIQSAIADGLLDIVKESTAQYNGQPIIHPTLRAKTTRDRPMLEPPTPVGSEIETVLVEPNGRTL